MVKCLSSRNVLVGTVSVLSLLCLTSTQAKVEVEDSRSTFGVVSRVVQSAAKTAWDNSPNFGITGAVQRQATFFVKGKAEDLLNTTATTIAKAAQSKLHALIYRDASVHVVNENGERIGYVEAVAPRLVRNILKNQLGIDVEQSIPGVPAFVMKAVGNYLENQLASTLEQQVFEGAKGVAAAAAVRAVGKAMGLAEDKVQQILRARDLLSQSVEVDTTLAVQKADVKKNLKAQGVTEEEAEVYGNVIADLAKNLAARLKINLNDWIQTSVNEVATHYANLLIDQVGETSLRYGEVTTGATVAGVTGVLTGGSAVPALVATAFSGDNYLATHGNDSFLRRGIKWLSGYNNVVASAKKKAELAVGTSLNLNSLFSKFGFTQSLVVTDKDYVRAYGKYGTREADDFVELYQEEKPVNFTTLFERARDGLARAKARVVEEARHAASAFVEAADQFTVALYPQLADDFWDDQPQQVAPSQPETSKRWYQFWR